MTILAEEGKRPTRKAASGGENDAGWTTVRLRRGGKGE